MAMLLSAGCGQSKKSNNISAGMKAVSNQEYDSAMTSFQTALEESEDERLAYRGMGMAYMGMTQYEEAVKAFETALSYSDGIIDDVDYDINFYMAAAYYKNGQPTESENVYDSILKMDDGNAAAYEMRGKIRLELGDYDAAVEDFDKAVDLDPKDYDSLIEIYTIFADNGYMEAGKEYLQKALDEGEKSMPDLQKGMIYYYMSDYDNARVYLEKAKATGAQAVIYLGRTYEGLGDYNYACSVYNNYLAGDANAEVYNQLGICMMGMGDYDAALTAFQTAMQLEEVNCMQSLKYNEIVAYEYLGDYQNAAVLMSSYLTAYPDDIQAQREAVFLNGR